MWDVSPPLMGWTNNPLLQCWADSPTLMGQTGSPKCLGRAKKYVGLWPNYCGLDLQSRWAASPPGLNIGLGTKPDPSPSYPTRMNSGTQIVSRCMHWPEEEDEGAVSFQV